MPDAPLLKRGKDGRERIVGWLTYAGDYKPGDPPPVGYCDWQEWADVQTKAGLKQERCSRCGLYRFPQEIANTEERTTWVYQTKRDAMNRTNAVAMIEPHIVCKSCDAESGAERELTNIDDQGGDDVR